MTNTDWIEHDGKGLPVPEDTLVLVKYRNSINGDNVPPQRAYKWGTGGVWSNWNHEIPCISDIVAYKVVEE